MIAGLLLHAGTWPPWLLLLLLGKAIFLFGGAQAKFIEGQLVTAEKWAFLARFCFLSYDGQFKYELEYNKDYEVQRLLLYYDTGDQWPAIYGKQMNCVEREKVLKLENGQVVNLTAGFPYSGCEILPPKDGQTTKITCHSARSFRTARERWWFIAVSNCDSPKGLSLKYKLWMTNGPPGDFLYEHFSADEFYIIIILIVFLSIYILTVVISAICAAELRSRQLFHTTYKLYLISVAFQTMGIILLCAAYGRYGLNGVGYPSSKLLGRVCESISDIVFLLMLILIAKGYTITRGRLRQASAVKCTAFMCIYCVTYASLFIYQQEFFDPGRVLYIYESPAGYGLIVLRFIGWSMLIYSVFFTLKKHPEKSSFYLPFFGFYTLWCISGPVVIIIANHLIAKWVREKVVCGVEHSITFVGHFVFLVLTRPSMANRRFPFHVRTSQIGAMESNPTVVIGNSTLDRFGRHPYAPSAEPQRNGGPLPTPLDLFTVSGVVQMNGWYPRQPMMMKAAPRSASIGRVPRLPPLPVEVNSTSQQPGFPPPSAPPLPSELEVHLKPPELPEPPKPLELEPPPKYPGEEQTGNGHAS